MPNTRPANILCVSRGVGTLVAKITVRISLSRGDEEGVRIRARHGICTQAFVASHEGVVRDGACDLVYEQRILIMFYTGQIGLEAAFCYTAPLTSTSSSAVSFITTSKFQDSRFPRLRGIPNHRRQARIYTVR